MQLSYLAKYANGVLFHKDITDVRNWGRGCVDWPESNWNEKQLWIFDNKINWQCVQGWDLGEKIAVWNSVDVHYAIVQL